MMQREQKAQEARAQIAEVLPGARWNNARGNTVSITARETGRLDGSQRLDRWGDGGCYIPKIIMCQTLGGAGSEKD